MHFVVIFLTAVDFSGSTLFFDPYEALQIKGFIGFPETFQPHIKKKTPTKIPLEVLSASIFSTIVFLIKAQSLSANLQSVRPDSSSPAGSPSSLILTDKTLVK